MAAIHSGSLKVHERCSCTIGRQMGEITFPSRAGPHTPVARPSFPARPGSSAPDLDKFIQSRTCLALLVVCGGCSNFWLAGCPAAPKPASSNPSAASKAAADGDLLWCGRLKCSPAHRPKLNSVHDCDLLGSTSVINILRTDQYIYSVRINLPTAFYRVPSSDSARHGPRLTCRDRSVTRL